MVEPNEEPDRAARDRTTVELLVAGETAGLERLFGDHGAIVRVHLRRAFGKMLDELELDEVMSIASVRVWLGARRFDATRGTLRAWLAVITRNCAIRHLEQRRRRRDEPRSNLDRLELPLPAATSPKDRTRLIADLYRCIENLPPRQRDVLYADLEAGDTVPAAALATRLGTSANSVYVSRQRGRRALEAAMRRCGHYGGRPATADTPGTDDVLEAE